MCRSARLLEWLCGCVEHAEDRRFGGAGVGNMGFGGEVHKYSIGGSTAETKALLRQQESRMDLKPEPILHLFRLRAPRLGNQSPG